MEDLPSIIDSTTANIMIEVFKTNINTRAEAEVICKLLSGQLLSCCIKFDLEDCDRVLKIEGAKFNAPEIIELVTNCGYQCEVLE